MREVVDRRQELAVRQVPGRAEDHERRRMDRQALESLDERVLLGDRHRPYSACGCCCAAASAATTAWPPNWLRSAAFTFAANAFWPRDEKRS